MTTTLRCIALTVASLLWAGAAGAQTNSNASAPASQTSTSQSPPPPDTTTRPATTTFYGDTGLWYVPTAEILPNGKFSVSGYRRGTNWVQGYTNVGDFAGTFAVGIKDRAEIFGSFLFDTRIDRDLKPLFLVNNSEFGGIIDRYPRVNQAWSGDNIGDFYVGAKVNIWSEYRQKPAAIAVRGMLKLPTAKDSVGNGTGKLDGGVDLVISKEASKLVEIAGYGGYEWRGNPDGFDIPTGAFRWGAGVGFPSRNFLRVTAELNGDLVSNDTATITGLTLRAVDNSFAPLVSNTENITRATFGLTGQAKNGFFGGIGVSWNVPSKARNLAFTDKDQFGDYYDWQVRIGYHPGVRVYVPPPPPPPPPRLCASAAPLTANAAAAKHKIRIDLMGNSLLPPIRLRLGDNGAVPRLAVSAVTSCFGREWARGITPAIS